MSSIMEVIENWEELEFEDKEFSFELMKKGLIEIKRSSLEQRIKEAKKNYSEGNVKIGSSKELFKDLESV